MTVAERKQRAEQSLRMIWSKYKLGYLDHYLLYAEVQRATQTLSTDRISQIMEMPYWEILEKFGEG